MLVRLEDSRGAIVRNDYAAPNHTIGPESLVRTDEQWIFALRDSRPAEALRTLVWLGGTHSRPIENPGNIYIGTFADALLHQNVRNHPDTKPAVKALVKSPIPWIAEAARVTLESWDDFQ